MIYSKNDNNSIPISFTNPKLHNVLTRENLIDLLKKRSDRKLILIHAKAGQGKSTLIADFIRKTNKESIWIRLTNKESDPLMLMEKWDTAVCTLFPSESNTNNSEKTELSIQKLFNKLTLINETPAYLVLEDFQNINQSKEACSIINQLIDNIPPEIHLIILSREYPKLLLSNIRSQKELFELFDKDLAFAEEDVQRLLSDIYKLEIDEDKIKDICNIIDGWITGYIFLFEKLSCTEDIEEQYEIIDDLIKKSCLYEAGEFFEEQIFSSCSDKIKKQLLKLSYFDIITPQLIEKILSENGQTILSNYESSGYFISVIDRKKNYYSFHPLFQYILQTHSNKLSPDEISVILKIGAEFYKETEDYEKAIFNLIRLGNTEDARNIFLVYAEKLLDQSKYRKIRKILDFFPVEILKSDMLLDYYRVIAENLKNPFSTRKKFPELLAYFRKAKDYDRQARIYSVLLANYFFYQDSNELVIATAKEAEEFLHTSGNLLSENRKEVLLALIPIGQEWKTPVNDTAFEKVMMAEETSMRFNNHEAFLCSRLVLARKYIQRGEFSAANTLLEKTKELFDKKHRDHPYNSLVSFYLGDTFFYLGDIYKAIQNVQEALTHASEDFSFRPYLEQNLILYHLYLDKYEPAESLLENSRQNEKYENLYLKYFRSYLLPMLNAYRRGNRRRTDYYCKRLMADENKQVLSSDYPYSYIQLIEVNISLEHFKVAEELLDKIEKDISGEYVPYSLATMHALRGLLLYLQNKETAASHQFDKMDIIFSEKGYRNLDICSPEILDKIAEISRFKYFSDFPRLKSRLVASSIGKKEYTLEIKTLGTFSLYIKGREIASSGLMSQKRVVDLLKLLIIYRKNGILKEMIYEPFWPKYSSKSARDNLNTILYRLRNILGKENDILLTDSNTIGFKSGTTITDVDRFLEFLDLADAAERQNELGTAAEMYNKGLEIYKGDFLESDIYSDFIRDEREHLKQKYRLSLFKLSKLYLNTGNYLQALETLKFLINKDPLCEAGTRMLMITSALIGSRSNIPRILDNLNRQLMEEYDVSADKKTVQLQEMLLAGGDPQPEMWINETII